MAPALKERDLAWKDWLGLELPVAERPHVGGLHGGALGLLAATLLPAGQGALVLHPSSLEADDLAGDLELFGIAPERILLYPEAEEDEDGVRRRGALTRLHGRPGSVLLASSRAAAAPAPEPGAFGHSAVHWKPGHSSDGPEVWVRRLVDAGWRRASLVSTEGEFSARGDVLDLFPPGFDAPLRLEFFGDELEALRRFDPSTQRAFETLPEVRLPLVDLSDLGADGCTLLDHFDAEATLLLVDPDRMDPEAPAAGGRPGAALSSSPGGTRRLAVRQVEPVGSDVESLKARIREVCGADRRTFFVCRNEAEEQRIRHLLAPDLPEGLGFLRGRLSRSFQLPESKLNLLGYDDLLEHLSRRRPPARRVASRPIDDFLDLRKGDRVVHLSHGIGIFRGVERIRKRGVPIEHCVVEFHGDVRVYVPVSRIDLIQKYIGARGHKVRLAKVGGALWGRTKERARRAVQDLAVRLLDLQALRRRRPGIAQPADDAMQHEFEASFPYEETPDQITTMEALKTDMETARPMDRLLCGDVGYGKTELAMRAAFKTVLGGRQAAVLVPTTVLAAQHYTTFRERMAGYPVRVEMLSRFRTEREARVILEDLERGAVDIVIGTHRLLSGKVAFARLGLVVIDEEQRFGVEHKERLKSLRAVVDVLTMTATPIPRTLNLALLGLRDISNLTTAPEGRMPVHTEVRCFDKGLVREWILRELHRGGQVFFVHNRVETIAGIDHVLGALVPEARRAVVHGQMNRRSLESRMLDFVRGDVDLLVTTTIIESGLDIPNANTIIVDRADRIGLADLHQLRGRVGRGSHRAFALFMVPEDPRFVADPATRRLHAIEEHSQLGAGFRIAMKDLEIRGAGNILGAEQSGFIADVGYELYCRLLEDAVRELKEERAPPHGETYVDLDIDAHLPDEYAGDPALKLGLYRRIASAGTHETLQHIAAELRDRCGPPPAPVQLLFDVARLRVLGQEHGIGRFALETGGVLQMGLNDPERALPFLRRRAGRSLRLPEERVAILADAVDPPDPVRALRVFLDLLG